MAMASLYRMPFLGVSSLNFGPLATVASFFVWLCLFRRDGPGCQFTLDIRDHLSEGLIQVVG
jgi:hypothetical protein